MRVLAVAFGSCILAFAAAVTALVFSGATADATSFTLTSTTPVTNWSDVTRWNGGTGSAYPGQNPGDIVSLSLSGTTLNIDVAIPNPVQLNISGSIPVTIPTNSSLVLLPSSSATSQNTFTVNGGTLGVNAGASLSSWQGPVTINSGTLSVGTGGLLQMAAGSSFTFNGGTINGGGTVRIPSGHFASFTGTGGSMTLDNVVFDNVGTTTYNSTSNPLAINNGAQLQVETGSTFNYSTAQPINSDNVSSPKIAITGNFNVSSGFSPTINAEVDDGGTITLLDTGSAQTLTLAGGGTQTGTFTYGNSSSILRLGGGTHNLNTGVSIPALSTLEVTGATVNQNTSISVATLNLSGGTLAGPSTMSATAMNWTGGTISGSGGTGGVSVASTTNINGGATTLTNAGALVTNGTVHYQPTAAMAVNTGGTIDNYNVWQFENGIGMTSDLQLYNGTQAPQFFNFGTVSKAVPGATTIGVPFTTSGPINLSNAADIEAGGGATFNGGTLTFTSSSDIFGIPSGFANVPNVSSFAITGPGTLRVNGTGFLSDAKGLTIPNFEIDNGGGLSESSTMLVTTALRSTGATINGGGAVSLNSPATGDLTSLAGSFSLSNVTFNNSGIINYNPAYPLAFNGSAIFNNLGPGTLNILGSGGTSTSGIGNGFTNAGTITRSGPATYFTFDLPFTNTGTVSVTGANDFIAFNGGGSMSSGTIQGTVPTAGIEFGGGTFNVTGGSFGTAGGVKVNGGTLNVNASTNAPAGFALIAGTLGGTGTLTLPSGSTGNISGGTISSTTLTAAAGSTLNFDTTSGSPAINTSTINVNGSATANWSGTNTLAISGATTINNAGTFNLNSDATMSSPSFATINNTGLFRKASGTGTSSINPQVINTGSGITQAQTGTLAFYNGGSIGGGSTLIVNTGATAQFAAGTWNFTSGAVSASNGTFLINGANVNVNFLFSIGYLHLVAGTLTVPTSQTLTVGGAVTLDGGTISGGGVTQMNNPSGTVTVNAGNTTAIDNGQTFRSYGATTYNSQVAFPMMLTNSGVFENELGATFTATQNGSVGGDATGIFRNFGTVTRSAGASTRFDAQFVNGGTVNPGTGTILFMKGGSSTGTLSPASGTTLEFGAGTFQITGGSLAFASGSTLKVSGGTLQLNVAGSVPTLLLANGTLQDNAGLTFAGGTWSGGTLSGTGTTQNSGTLTLSGSSTSASLNAHTLTNSGTINYQPSSFSLSLDNGATITNSAAATFDLKNDSPIASTGVTSSINNAGTVKKSAGVATSVAANLNNSGTVLAQAGTMTFNNFTQTAGTTTLGPGSVGAANLTFSGGSLTGSGTLAGNVSVGNATVSPGSGLATGAIAVTGNYSQSAGTLNARIGGTGAAQFDHLDATGAVTLSGGTLNASFFNAFSPVSGDTFDVVTFGSESGDFAAKTLPVFPAGGAMTASYTPASLRLTAIVTQADVRVTQSGPSSVLHNQNDVITVTITNLGSTASNGVTVSDTFGGATFVSANPSQGSCAAPSGGTFTCSLGTLNGTSSATITLTLNAGSIGTITNNAVVSASTYDPNSTNNDTSSTTPYSATVLASSDLGVSITDSPDPVPASGNITYTVALTNAGPDASGSIPVALTISGGNIVSASGTGPCSPASSTTWNCTAASLASGGSSNITVLAQATSPTLVQLSAVVNYVQDPNSGNNSASQSTTVNASADVAITKSGPATAAPGTIVTYVVNVMNNGPSDANGVVVTDTAPARLQFLSLSSTSGCIAFPCNIGLLTAGSTVSIQAHYKVTPGAPGPVTNTATVTATTQDANTGNNTASAQTQLTCVSQPPQITAPAAAATNVPTNGVITWNNAGFSSYNVYFGKKGTACNSSTPTATVNGTSFSFSNLESNADYEVRIEGISNGCPNISSSCLTFRTGVNCAILPSPISPVSTTAASPVHFSWTLVPGATQYEVFLSNGTLASSIGTTGDTSLDANAGDGAFSWFVVATVPGCGSVTGPTATFNVCNDSVAPVAGVVAQAAAGQSYTVQWDAVPGATKYEIDEALNAQFANATTQTVTTTSVGYQHTAQNAPQAYFYRVRAFGGCKQTFSSYSQTVRVVIVPIPKNQQNTNVNVPAGSTTPVTQDIFIPGIAGGTFNFFATGDKPWITVSPASGVLTPDGVTLHVSANPADLPNGTFTATVLLTLTPLSVANTAHTAATSSTVSVPVSVSLVTPVVPSTNPAAAASTLIIPSVGHLDGLDSHWQSDIRVANTAASAQKYTLTFNPSDNSGVKSTNVTIDAGATIALDDIVKNWYGIGALGEAANGVLSIRPASTSSLPGQQLTTVASSRTYNVAASGTLGQYIPALPFGNFIGAAAAKGVASILSLQQIAQSAQYRTNFGVVEAGGQPATVLLSVFDASGAKLKDITLDVKPFEQLQLNSMLATNGIPSLTDGRVEAKVLSGGGKVTAYASVVDNNTQDPLLVSGVPLGTTTSKDYVLPGVADLNSPFASWRTDMRVFNSSTVPQLATLTFYPLGNNGAPQTTTLSINPGEVKTIDNTLQTLFGAAAANLGGAIHVSTLNDSSLVVTGRTFNKTDTGTYGQFIPAITPADAVGNGGRTLQILQVEDSPRYRTNLGIAEVSGKPVTVEVTVILPDSRVSPRLEIPLAANEYRQEALLSEIGLGNVYNARIAVRVIGGDGKISAYGSVIDRQTQDPTYVPAQ